MLRTWWRQSLVVVLFLLIASCSGGGCSSCSSCGIAPIPGGFAPADTITNSASVRVTKHGLEFLSANLPGLASTLLGRSGGGGGVIDFDIPPITDSIPVTIPVIGSVGNITINVCQGGSNATTNPEQCIAEIGIGAATLTINAITPDAISLTGSIPIRIQEIIAGGTIEILGISYSPTIDFGVGTNLSCNTTSGGLDPGAGYASIPLTVTLPLVAETIPPRVGYTKIDTHGATASVGLTSSDLLPCSTDTGIGGDIVNAILGSLTGTITGVLTPQINNLVLSELQSQLCTKANSALDPPCPTGTVVTDDGGGLFAEDGGIPATEPNCDYVNPPPDAGSCLPIELGLEGNINLGSLLSSISPGTTGALNFALAGNGNMIPAPGAAADSNGNTPNGITLGMLGGGLPAPQSDCVPVAPNPMPSGLVIPNQMMGDNVTGYGGVSGDAGAADDGGATSEDGGVPDLGVAIDQQFLNYFLGSAYNSGVLCLGITTEKYQQLNTGLVSLLIPSVKTLTFEQKAAAIAITTRPQKPPVIALGGGTNLTTDPLLGLTIPSFALDFYVWSEDRYVRAFTFTADLTVPINIQSSAAGLQPILGTLGIANGTVTNNELLTDPPAAIASGLQGVLGSLVGQLLGSAIPAINLGSALSSIGLDFTIPAGGIQTIKQTDDAGTGDSYLGLFGSLSKPGSPIPQIDTQAQLVGKTVHPEAMALTTYDPAKAPSLHATFASSADGVARVEYSYQVDQGTFSAWSSSRDVNITDPVLWMQAKHTLNVVSRVAGVPASQDPTPATVPFTIDVLPPSVALEKQDLGWAIVASDIVSPASALVARTRTTDANGKASAWTDWQPLAGVAVPQVAGFEVQVRDEEGNVGSVSSQLIRGNPDPTLPASGGCSSGCATASHTGSGWPAIVIALGALALLFGRRRLQGVAGARGLRMRPGSGALIALGSIAIVSATNEGCTCGNPAGTGATGELDAGPDANPGNCGQGCDQACGPALPQGLIGAYTSIATASDGTLWVAGYNDAAVDPSAGVDLLYGDLVVGKYSTTSQSVAWVTVDGLPPPLPDDVCPPNDATGWRGGLVDPGPDVGLWTSIALDASGHPMVAYYDSTNQALKFASSPDGVTWSTHAVFANAGTDAGRYAKMILVNGNPVIAYLSISGGTNGYSTSKVSLAHATKALPAQASDWEIEDALVDDTTPCRAQDCASGQACVVSTGICTTISTGCDAACATGEACIDVSNVPTCTKIAATSDIHPYPDAVGDYINVSSLSDGIGLLIYDRIHGNLIGLTNSSGAWVQTILDGETGSRAAGTAVDTGDDGVGASLFVASNGDWHASYVDGITETLKYLYIPGGTLANTLVPQIVDNGSAVDGNAFSDGVHIIGDDSNVLQNSDGSITITYMDATAGTLRLATGATTPGSVDGGTWTLHAFSQPNEFAGFFPHFVPGNSTIENWWRWADPTSQAISGNVAIVSP